MKTLNSLENSFFHLVNLNTRGLTLRIQRVAEHTLRAYADWRIGATRTEKYAHRSSESIIFTFDDFGSSEQIERLLEILRIAGTRAIFFLNGNWADKNPDDVKKISSAGHIVGNHTFSHPLLTNLSDEDVRREIIRGIPSKWLRPPQGKYDSRVRRIANELGYRICYWTIDSGDWQGFTAKAMLSRILPELHPGAVILFHAHANHTAELLPNLIAEIRQRGYALCAQDENVWST